MLFKSFKTVMLFVVLMISHEVAAHTVKWINGAEYDYAQLTKGKNCCHNPNRECRPAFSYQRVANGWALQFPVDSSQPDGERATVIVDQDKVTFRDLGRDGYAHICTLYSGGKWHVYCTFIPPGTASNEPDRMAPERRHSTLNNQDDTISRMSEGMSRRNFIFGSIAAAGALGSEQAEAKELTQEDMTRLRTEMREVLKTAIPYLKNTLASEKGLPVELVRELTNYVLAGEMVLAGETSDDFRDERTRRLIALFADNPSDATPRRVVQRTREVLGDVSMYVSKIRKAIGNPSAPFSGDKAVTDRMDAARINLRGIL